MTSPMAGECVPGLTASHRRSRRDGPARGAARRAGPAGPRQDVIRCLVTATDASIQRIDTDGLSAMERLRASFPLAQGAGGVALVECPEEADVILFAEAHTEPGAVREVLRHPLRRAFPRKTVVHSGMDDPDPAIPGLFPSIDRRWARALCCEGSAFVTALNPYIAAPEPPGEVDPPLLASFMGSCPGKRVRERLRDTALRQRWDDIAVQDSGPAFVRSLRQGDRHLHEELKRDFAAGLVRSRFVLCPAGSGPSSFRIFEAMKAARAPVVIADRWDAPPGPDWDSFLIRIPERDIARLPRMLRREADTWQRRGALARAAWEDYFDPATFGPHIVTRAQAVLDQAAAHPARRRAAAWLYASGIRPARDVRSRVARKARRLLR